MLSLSRWPTVYKIIGIGCAAMIAAPSLNVAWANLCFAVASIAVTAALFIAISLWRNSKFLHQKRREIWNIRRENKSSQWIAGLKIKWWESSAIIGLLLLACTLFYFIYEMRDTFLLSQEEGVLYPATDPTPSHNCGVLKDGQIAIFTGTNVWVPDSFPHSVLRINGEDRLVINRDSDGAIRLSLDIFDARETLVMRMENGTFRVNRYHLWGPYRKDWSTLQLKDLQGKQILKMRYLNKQAILIDAVLRYPGVKEPTIMDGSSLLTNPTGGTKFSRNCFTGKSGIDIYK